MGCVSMGVNNTYFNVGLHNSVILNARKKNENTKWLFVGSSRVAVT